MVEGLILIEIQRQFEWFESAHEIRNNSRKKQWDYVFLVPLYKFAFSNLMGQMYLLEIHNSSHTFILISGKHHNPTLGK